MTTTFKKDTALVGFGYWGKNILRNLHEIGTLHTACDSSKENIEAFKLKYPDVKFTDSFDDILEDDEVGAVALATPAITHFDMASRAIEAGKDVFVEKPLALTAKDGAELNALAKDKGRVVMVGPILQYHTAVIKLKELIDNGTLGDIEYIYSNRLNIGKLRTEENILWSFAPHDISVLLMLIGKEPSSVSAHGGAYLTEGVYDTTMTTLTFEGGIKGHIFVSWLHPFKEQKLVVIGNKAMAVFDDMNPDGEKLLLYPHKIEWEEGKAPIARKAEHEVVPVDAAEPLRRELEEFAICRAEGRSPKTDGEEGLRVLKVLEAAERSMKGE